MPLLESSSGDQCLRLFKHKIVPYPDISRTLDDMQPCQKLRPQIQMSNTLFFYFSDVPDSSYAILQNHLMSSRPKENYDLCMPRFCACNFKPFLDY
jgi:hypothetical protein